MITRVLKADETSLKEASNLIKNGEIVAVPTETVYGIAGNAYNSDAIKKIFLAKGRPQDNPLIVHIDGEEMLKDVAVDIPKTAYILVYWMTKVKFFVIIFSFFYVFSNTLSEIHSQFV